MGHANVSIIVPVYNSERYLKQCLDSLVNQTMQEIEIICVNDGSTDNSLQIIMNYAEKDNRIKIIDKENEGQGAARKTGLKQANGEYISFVDSDDWLKLDSYEKLHKNAISNRSDIVMFDINRYDENKNKYTYFDGCNVSKYLDNENIVYNEFIFDYTNIKPFLLNKSFSPCAKIYKNKFLKCYDDFYFPKHTIYEDVPFHVQILLRAKKISYYPEMLYIYRISNVNSSTARSSISTKKVFDIFTVVNKVEDILIDHKKIQEFKYEFFTFKIVQLIQWLNKCNVTLKNEFFEQVKANFEKMSLEDDEINVLNPKIMEKYQNIRNSRSYEDFVMLDGSITESVMMKK